MATAAFRSTTKRTSITGAAADDLAPARIPSELTEFEGFPSTRRKFINTVRGAGFPEVSLDDLAIQLFSSGERRRSSDHVSSGTQRSRHSTGISSGRRRRSLSAVRYGHSDSESDHSEKYTCHSNAKTSNNENKQKTTLHKRKKVAPTQLRGLRRCSSQRDFLKLHDSCSSQSYSSALSEDEACDACYGSDGFENLQSVYARKKSDLFIRSGVNNDQLEAVHKKHGNVVEELRTGLEQLRVKQNLSGLENGGRLQPKVSDALSNIRSYSTELKQPEKLKQQLLADIILEEQHGKELKITVGELLPGPKKTCASKRTSQSRKRNNDNQRISRQLNGEAEKIMEDFISSVEDNTDISSFDGERSDTSSTFGVPMRPRDSLMHFGEAESYRTPPRTGSLPVEMDGVVFPWLLWETSNDDTSQLKDKKQVLAFPNTSLEDAREEISTQHEQKQSNQSNSGRECSSPALDDTIPLDLGEVNRTTRLTETRKSRLLTIVARRSRVDLEAYLAPQNNEEFLAERWKQRSMISSGSILMCEGSRGPLPL